MSKQQNSDKLTNVKKDMAEAAAAEKRASRLDYDSIAFMLKKPHSQDIAKGPYRIRSRDEHRKLVDYAKQNGLYVWYGSVAKVGDKYMLVGQHLIDWDSVPEPGGHNLKPTARPSGDERDDDEAMPAARKLVCSQCGKRCTSASGLTLHIKHSHS